MSKTDWPPAWLKGWHNTPTREDSVRWLEERASWHRRMADYCREVATKIDTSPMQRNGYLRDATNFEREAECFERLRDLLQQIPA